MALMRSGKKSAAVSTVLFCYSDITNNCAFYTADGTLLETTGGSFTDKHGISVSYVSSGNYSITNNTGDVIKVWSCTSGTLTTINDEQTSTVNNPIIFGLA